MKVFAFDPATGKRGQEVIGNVNCQGYSNSTRPACKIPPHNKATTNWVVADAASGRGCTPITPEMFGQEAICFCIGQMFCGTDASWEWVALVKPASKV